MKEISTTHIIGMILAFFVLVWAFGFCTQSNADEVTLKWEVAAGSEEIAGTTFEYRIYTPGSGWTAYQHLTYVEGSTPEVRIELPKIESNQQMIIRAKVRDILGRESNWTAAQDELRIYNLAAPKAIRREGG